MFMIMYQALFCSDDFGRIEATTTEKAQCLFTSHQPSPSLIVNTNFLVRLVYSNLHIKLCIPLSKLSISLRSFFLLED